jgi:hypothetical protein
MHPLFSKIGEIEDRVIEECSELIKDICKAKRFGYFNFHPFKKSSPSNIKNIKLEIIDIMYVLKEYQNYLQEKEK